MTKEDAASVGAYLLPGQLDREAESVHIVA
jgi:hypothetical protein